MPARYQPPPSVVLVLYAMIARQPVLELWLAGVGPGLLMAAIFMIYIFVRCLIQPEIGPALPAEERAAITWRERFALLRSGILPLAVFAIMMALFMTGTTSLVESSAVGAALATLAAWMGGNLNREVLERVPSGFFSVSLAAHGDLNEAEGYLEQFEQETGWQPAKVALFGGALLYTHYGFFKRRLMKKIASEKPGHLGTDTSRDYVYTEWDAVRGFAEDFLAHLSTITASQPGWGPM